jgi:cyanophycinase
MSYVLLEGGAEFSGLMSEPDLRAMELAGGVDAQIVILPTAAAPDNNHERAGRNGVRWFQSLGATHLDLVPVTDKTSANSPALAARIRAANFIYMLGGFPRHLGETLQGSLAWRSALEAYAEGALIGGSSAGAMVLGDHYFDPYENKIHAGLGLLARSCVLPHHNHSGKHWVEQLRGVLPDAILIGIDEQTGMLYDQAGKWTVYGGGKVTLYRPGQDQEIHAHAEMFKL